MTSIIVLGDRNPQHVTHRALDAVLAQLPDDVDARWVATDDGDPRPSDGIWVAPGSPYRDAAAVLRAIERARAARLEARGVVVSAHAVDAGAAAFVDEARGGA